MKSLNERASHRWSVILAGGDGTRLLPLTRKISGDDRPKQFCALTGGETLLDQTRRRISRLVPERQTLILLTQTHERFYADQLAAVDPSRLLVQPHNHGTAPAIAYALTRLEQMDPDGVVAFFPSDHHFGDDQAFVHHIESAYAQAQSDSERVVLLGIMPEAPEESYGWIEPGSPLGPPTDRPIFRVKRFWEKPSRAVAAQLMRNGCVWNSFVMVGHIRAFLDLIRETLPDLLASMVSMACDQEGEVAALRNLYRTIPATNFSSDVLSVRPGSLAVLRAGDLGWSDLGEPQRVYSVIDPHSAMANPAVDWMSVGATV